MSAFYNEIDPFAAAWLRQLQRAGAIAEVAENFIRAVMDVLGIDSVTP